MNNIVPLRAGQMPAIFANRSNLPDMNQAANNGIQASFCVIGYKGKNWRLKYRGEDELVKDDKGVPIPSLPVVIVGVSPAISKQWYDKKFAEGDNEAPDCFSINGIAPDDASPKKQCSACAVCPQNVWGSRMTDNGKKAKSCQDSRRIAVVPLGDIGNESYGGPMLLRVPPMSLGNLAKFGNEMARFGAQPYMVATELGFDYDVAYPLIKFTALGWLTEDQAREVAKVMEDPLISRMLETEVIEATADPVGEQSALAGGAPAAAFQGSGGPASGGVDYAKVEADLKAAQDAAQAAAMKAAFEAKARADALAQAQAQAEATRRAQAQEAAAQAEAQAQAQQAQTQAQTRAAPAKRSPFGALAAAPATNQAMAAAETAQETGAVVLQQAPQDMNAAIDDLLAS